MASVSTQHVFKTYTDTTSSREVYAVRDLSLRCEDGEFLVLLGPSGCGKTSTLRMIAGLEDVGSGSIHIGEQCVNTLPTKARNIGMAFENYALYPPLSARENLVFPLKAKGFPAAEIEKRLKSVVDILDIGNILDRRPGELSGGQQQRISLGRCIIRDADVYLLDEPLSHLDSELRLRTRGELKRIHILFRRSMIYVTHDQIEAMSLADRIAVMNDGTLQQIGTPRDVFDNPANVFVADFIGEPPMNFMEGEITADDDTLCFAAVPSGIRIPLPVRWKSVLKRAVPDGLVLGIRPHRIVLGERPGLPFFQGRVNVYESLGEAGILEVDLAGIPMVVQTESDLPIQDGEKIVVSMDISTVVLFEKESGRAIPHPD